MNFKDRIEKSLRESKKRNYLKDYHSITFILSKDLHIPPHELMGYPIPMVMELIDQLSEFNKKQAKASKKK